VPPGSPWERDPELPLPAWFAALARRGTTRTQGIVCVQPGCIFVIFPRHPGERGVERSPTPRRHFPPPSRLLKAGNSALGIEKTLLATLPPTLLGAPPVMGDLNGDKIGDWVVLSPTGLSVAYGQDLFGGAANALGALNGVGGDVFAPLAGVLVDPFTPHDGGTPRQPRLSTARASAA
jgi:hypothetical protein